MIKNDEFLCGSHQPEHTGDYMIYLGDVIACDWEEYEL
jgi:hypothetical protein